ncbi:hypothetical protein B0T16DRAFT_414789 [Cercophora newfieldiana]|uniref:Uncharacterized protein n=1 Tax=Cercophora newfieldiana TaxID=92897 RepID=A0AA39Y6X7_9PEZI|nr:hypothetical protein B0T16DRAFT_414789 [Cercophora newfieldiana]
MSIGSALDASAFMIASIFAVDDAFASAIIGCREKWKRDASIMCSKLSILNLGRLPVGCDEASDCCSGILGGRNH